MNDKPQLPAIMQERGVDTAQYNVLKTMIFPDAKDDNIIAVAIDYCKARKLDIMKKPVHIVSTYSTSKKCWIETVWPSIYEYRATAARTGLYAGKDEPKFGKEIQKEFGNEENGFIKIRYPKWCKLTVYKFVNNEKCAFTGTVFWDECVVITKKYGKPNSMWQKRTYSQLAKCAEAEALRAAFPDELGGIVTAEEMEGRDIHSAEPVNAGAETTGDVQRFHDRVKEDADTIIDGEAETIEDDDKWNGQIIIEGAIYRTTFANTKDAVTHLKGLLTNKKRAEDRISIINENLSLIQALAAEGSEDVINELHQLADKGAK